MSITDAAPQPGLVLGTLGCAALVCLFVVSAAVLVMVLVRRNRRK